MKAIDPNYEPTSEGVEFEKFENGTYNATGIKWMASNMDGGKPILTLDNFGNLTARLKFDIEEKEFGPPMSLPLDRMVLLVRGFGGDLAKLPKIPPENYPDQVSAYMLKVQELCKGNTKVAVWNDWVNEIKGAEIPKGYFHFVIEDFTPKSKGGLPQWKDGSFGPEFYIRTRIVAGEGGDETPFAGCIVSQRMSYALVVDGEGKNDWYRNASNEKSAAASYMGRLMVHSTDGVFDNDFELPDPTNVLPYWFENLVSGKVLKASRITATKSPRLNKVKWDWSSVEPAGYNVENSSGTEVHAKDNSVETKAQKLLISVFCKMADTSVTEGGIFNLNDKGIELARKYINPLMKEDKVVHGAVERFTFEEVQVIIESINERNEDAYREDLEELLKIGIRVDKPEEEVDTPF